MSLVLAGLAGLVGLADFVFVFGTVLQMGCSLDCTHVLALLVLLALAHGLQGMQATGIQGILDVVWA